MLRFGSPAISPASLIPQTLTYKIVYFGALVDFLTDVNRIFGIWKGLNSIRMVFAKTTRRKMQTCILFIVF